MNLMNVLFQQMATEYLRETAVCGPHLSLSPFDYLPYVEHSGEVSVAQVGFWCGCCSLSACCVPGPGQGLDPAEPAARYPPKEQASPQGKQSIMET